MAVGATDVLDELLAVRGRTVLDVGCGEGWLVRRLTAAGADAVGLDPLAPALERARAADPDAPPARYVQGVAERLPFADSSFDAVVFFNALHHVPVQAMDAALVQAGRVLAPGGLLYVQEPLAAGAFFELMAPIEDETGVRAAAQEALERAAGGSWRRVAVREDVIATELADFGAFRDRMTSVDPQREAALARHHDELHDAFERLAQHSAGGSYVFDQPFRVHVLAA